MELDLESYEADLRRQSDLSRSRGMGVPVLSTITITPLMRANITFKNVTILKVPFSVLSVDYRRGDIVNVQYSPELQKYNDIPDTLQNLDQLTLMLLYTHRNGKFYLAKTLFDVQTQRLLSPL